MTLLHDITNKIDEVEELEDQLDQCKAELDSLVRPVFKAIKKNAVWVNKAIIENVSCQRDGITVWYSFRYDDSYENCLIDKKFLAATDPLKAALEWATRSEAQQKAQDKRRRKEKLEKELKRLEAE